MTMVAYASHRWYVNSATGEPVWDTETDGPVPAPASSVDSPVELPTVRFASIGLAVGFVPALIAGFAFWHLGNFVPYLEWVSAVSAFIVVMRGVRRMTARVLLKRFAASNAGPIFAGNRTAVGNVRPGLWVLLPDGTVSRSVAVHRTDDLHPVLILQNGVAVDGAKTRFVQAGSLVRSGT